MYHFLDVIHSTNRLWKRLLTYAALFVKDDHECWVRNGL